MSELSRDDRKEDGAIWIEALVKSQKPDSKTVEERRQFTGNPNLDENDIRADNIIGVHNYSGLSLEEIDTIIKNTEGDFQEDMLEALSRAKLIIDNPE